jgi:hypothetical protein
MEEKAKLIKLSANSWHYKLIKFWFGKAVKEPKNIKNLCPYFWMMMGALLITPLAGPFYLIYSGVRFVLRMIAKLFNKFLDSKINKWINSISDVEAWDLFFYAGYDTKLIERPGFVAGKRDYDLLKIWAAKKGIDVNDKKFESKIEKYFEKIKAERALRIAERQKIDSEESNIRWKKSEAKRNRDLKIKETLDSVFQSILEPFRKIGKSISKPKVNMGSVIKIAKRVTGFIITAILMFLMFFVVQGITWVIMAISSVWNTGSVVSALLFLLKWGGIIVLLLGVIIGIAYLISIAKIQYTKGKISWWYAPFIYIGLGVWYLVKYMILYPGYFIFVSCIWKFFAVGVIWGILKGLGKGFLKFTGIFGEYFSGSYGDYCPGISWEEEESTESK